MAAVQAMKTVYGKQREEQRAKVRNQGGFFAMSAAAMAAAPQQCCRRGGPGAASATAAVVVAAAAAVAVAAEACGSLAAGKMFERFAKRLFSDSPAYS